MRARLLSLMFLLAFGALLGVARADGPAPDAARVASAQAHYERGEALYQEKNYGAAWLEFNSSYQILPLPELLYNMARCEARTRRKREAVAHFQAFLTARPDDAEAPAIRKEMAALEAALRVAPEPGGPATEPGPMSDPIPAQSAPVSGDPFKPLPPAPVPRPVPLYSIIGGAVSFVVLLTGVAALGASQSQYNELSSRCAPSCSPEEVSPVRGMNAAGFAFLGIGLVAASATAVLLPLELRWRRKASPLALGLLLPSPLGLAGSF